MLLASNELHSFQGSGMSYLLLISLVSSCFTVKLSLVSYMSIFNCDINCNNEYIYVCKEIMFKNLIPVNKI